MKEIRSFFVMLSVVFLLTAPVNSGSYAANTTFYTMSASQIGESLDAHKGRRLLFIYASWCGYCRQAMPKMIELAKQYPGAVVAVSVDQNPADLLSYLESFGELPFRAIVWDRAEKLSTGLARFGIEDAAGIPFTALIDEYGYVTSQGVIEPQDSAKYLARGSRSSGHKNL